MSCSSFPSFSSSFPQQTFPTSSFPTSTFPTSSYPSGCFPTSSFPTSSFPSSTPVPSSTPFPSSFPCSTFPSSTFPSSTPFPQTFPPSHSFPSQLPSQQPAFPQTPSFPPGATPLPPVTGGAFVNAVNPADGSVSGMIQLCSEQEMEQAFASTLQLLKQDIVPNLKPLEGGRAMLAVPFCAAFEEAPIVHAFLKEVVETVPAEGIDVHVFDTQHTVDPTLEALDEHPQITYMTSFIDLASQPMPPASLTMAIHPNLTQPGWDEIIQNVVNNSNASLFFLYAEPEKERLEEICQEAGYACVCKQNPFAKLQYAQSGVPINDSFKKYNFLGLVRKQKAPAK